MSLLSLPEASIRPSPVQSMEKFYQVPRELARISPFDSAVQGGDAVGEGVRDKHVTFSFLKMASRVVG